jgi:hypothetical protein
MLVFLLVFRAVRAAWHEGNPATPAAMWLLYEHSHSWFGGRGVRQTIQAVARFCWSLLAIARLYPNIYPTSRRRCAASEEATRRPRRLKPTGGLGRPANYPTGWLTGRETVSRARDQAGQ